MTIYQVVAAGVGLYMIDAPSAAVAKAYVRRRHGTAGGPYAASRATRQELRDHLEASGMVLRHDGATVPAADAFDAAGLPAPSCQHLTLRQMLGGGFPQSAA